MRDMSLQAAGILAIFVAVLHGVIAEWQIFARARIEPRRTCALVRMVWQASTVDWIAVGALLILLPLIGGEAIRPWVIAAAVLMYGYAAIGNAVANRGRHIGWVLMSGVVALALCGL